ncbi:MAG: tetratricopeptide repeat protein [Isosphaeraceae bacterium]
MRGSSRLRVLGICAPLIALVGLVAYWTLGESRSPGERARLAYDREDWAAAESLAREALRGEPEDHELSRLLARTLARRGEATKSVARFVDAGSEGIAAEDLLWIGRALDKLDRPVLAIAAMDAALKLEPGSKEASRALVGLNDRATAVEGGPRQVEQLTAVPDGRALAELVLGLVAITQATQPAIPGRFDRVLDRLALLDRPAMARINHPDGARKRLVRLLLEEGRPAEAGRWLRRVSDLADDPEAQRLLSRVELLGGEIEKAIAASERSQGRGTSSPVDPEPCRYVGAKSCAGCHGAIHRSQQNSHHARTIGTGPALAVTPLPEKVLADPVVEGVTHRFDRQGERIVVESGPADHLVQGVVAYVMGSGHRGATMLARDDLGTMRSLRTSYYTGGDHWGLTSGFPPRPPDPRQFLGEPLDPLTVRDCLHCHSTRYRSPEDRAGPEVQDHGIGCERCHGPGESHLKSIETGFPELAIARPKIATPAERARLCAGCHAADGKIPPSDPRFIRFQSTTLPFSRCVSESGGRLDCVACHDPHRNSTQDASHYEARCQVCHAPDGKDDPKIRLERFPASGCPVNAKADCLNCHMPRVPEVLPHTAFTDHHIRIHGERTASDDSPTCPPAEK